MNKMLLVALLATSTLSLTGIGTPKAKALKAKAETTCSASCAPTASCKPSGGGCAPSPACPVDCRK